MTPFTSIGKSYLVRAGIYAAPTTYVVLRGLDKKDVKVLCVLYAPTICLLVPSALEGSVRSVVHLACSIFGNNQLHIRAAKVEINTAQRLLRGAFFPLNGIVLMYKEVGKFQLDQERSLIKDYYVFNTPYQLSKTGYIYLLKPIGRTSIKVARIGYDILDLLGFWKGITLASSLSARMINSGLGLAMNLLGVK